jgi:tRNA-dihydrouridine synthase B
MRELPAVPYGSIFFAPMEGITDENFRKTILKLYPEWDYLACDFLRVPAAGKYPTKHLIRHMGKELFEFEWVKQKTMYQILTSHTSFTEQLVRQLEELQVPWLDLNLGCPSNQVCRSRGGSYLLKDLVALRPLIRTVRENFKGRFSAKIRIGFADTDGFADSIRLLNDEGVELITVHGRTREQMYKEPANWKFIQMAVNISQVPIIGNGDVWETNDINRMLQETGCHGVMVARGALKSPWMAQDYRQQRYFEKGFERFGRIKEFFTYYRQQLEADNFSMRGLLRRSKSVSRFMLDGMENGEVIRRQLMLSQTVPEFFSVIDQF